MELTREHLAGQIAEEFFKMISNQRLAYTELPEAEQKAVIGTVERLATNVVDQAIDLVAGDGKEILNGTMKNVTYKGDVCSTTVCFDLTEDGVHDLSRKSHKAIKIAYVPGADEMRSLGERIKSDPDQPEMFDDDDGGHDHTADHDIDDDDGAPPMFLDENDDDDDGIVDDDPLGIPEKIIVTPRETVMIGNTLAERKPRGRPKGSKNSKAARKPRSPKTPIKRRASPRSLALVESDLASDG